MLDVGTFFLMRSNSTVTLACWVSEASPTQLQGLVYIAMIHPKYKDK